LVISPEKTFDCCAEIRKQFHSIQQKNSSEMSLKFIYIKYSIKLLHFFEPYQCPTIKGFTIFKNQIEFF
jgi:hypothetical protein